MALLKPTDKPILYAVKDGSSVLVSSITNIGDETGVRDTLTVVSNTDENSFLGAMVGDAGSYNPLPTLGKSVEANVIYSYNGSLVICRQTHLRTEHAPSEVPALFLTYRVDAGDAPTWIANENILVGQQRTYEGIVYVAIQAHQTVTGLTPDITPALWTVVPSGSSEWQIGVAYTIGDIVTYNGSEYECRQSHTSQAGWQPPNVLALWLPL